MNAPPSEDDIRALLVWLRQNKEDEAVDVIEHLQDRILRLQRDSNRWHHHAKRNRNLSGRELKAEPMIEGLRGAGMHDVADLLSQLMFENRQYREELARRPLPIIPAEVPL